MLQSFSNVRKQIGSSFFDTQTLQICGQIKVTSENLDELRKLEGDGFVRDCVVNGEARNLAILSLNPGETSLVSITMCPMGLNYFESYEDLIRRGVDEREEYYVYPLGMFQRGVDTVESTILDYRCILRAWNILRMTADLESKEKVIFLTPDRLELSFICARIDRTTLARLPQIEGVLSPAAIERDQRVALFKRSLREHLRGQPVEQRFSHFIQVFDSVYETYHRDFLLWIGQAFGELEKTFEEKRIKFVGDLNGVLAGVQTSILAVPLAALLLADKYDLANPVKNCFLMAAVTVLGVFALILLNNQKHTLESTKEAIEAVRQDFEKKHPQRKAEFRSRLEGLNRQERRVTTLLNTFEVAVAIIVFLTFAAVIVSIVKQW